MQLPAGSGTGPGRVTAPKFREHFFNSPVGTADGPRMLRHDAGTTTGAVPPSDEVRDPWDERIVARRTGDRHAVVVADRAAGLLTGVAVLVPSDGRAAPLLDRLVRWSPESLRVEQVSLAVVDHPDVRGGRAVALEEAVEQVSSDFVVVPMDHTADLDRVPELLVNMWLDGADVGLMGPTGTRPVVAPSERVARRRPLFVSPDFDEQSRPDRAADVVAAVAPPSEDTAARVAAWLGLAEAPVAGRVVVVRRWVARWLLNEIGRALDPVAEFADRARILGLGVVELVPAQT